MATFRPGKPKAILELSTAHVESTSAWTIVWDTEVVQERPGWTSGTDYVIPVEGLYLATFNLRASVATAGASLQAKIGGTYGSLARSHHYAPGAGNEANASVALLWEFLANDVVVCAVATSTGGFTVKNTYTTFSITRVGPKRWT